MDIGYSAVKGISQNYTYCFPAYAKKVRADQLDLKASYGKNIVSMDQIMEDNLEKGEIHYRDSKGVWEVGDLAYKNISDNDIIDNEGELFSRRRYFSEAFHVLTSVGLAIGLQSNCYGNPELGTENAKKICVQSGLPPKYLEDDDKDDLCDSIAGHYDFEIQIGSSEWKRYVFDVNKEDIQLMAQPLGSFFASTVTKDGRISKELTNKYLDKNVVIFDPGFGTLDDYTISNGKITVSETFPELGMKQVFIRTKDEIKKQYGVNISISELQNRLQDGKIKDTHDKKNMSSKFIDFSDILYKNCRDVCEEAIEKMKSVHNYFVSTDYIIATGGTYEAWKEQFDKVFENMEGLYVVPANANDPSLSNIFSNVKGYYYYRLYSKE